MIYFAGGVKCQTQATQVSCLFVLAKVEQKKNEELRCNLLSCDAKRRLSTIIFCKLLKWKFVLMWEKEINFLFTWKWVIFEKGKMEKCICSAAESEHP